MRRILFPILALLLLSPPAFAAGKPGLWTVITVWQSPQLPPALFSLAREQGLKPAVTGKPFVHHICMTPYEADGSEPLHLNSRDLDCVSRTVSTRGAQMLVESVCHGPLEGVTRAKIAWRGDRHFEGSSDFRGKFRGDPARISSSFTADWLGEDCRGVRPFIPPSN